MQLVEPLQQGKIGIMLCDTIFGIVGIAPDTEEPIKRAKGRGEAHPFLQLIAPEWFSTYSSLAWPHKLTPYWPGPLTVITTTSVPPHARPSSTAALPHAEATPHTTAFRAPKGSLLTLVRAVGKPLYSTSANISGTPYHGNPKQLIDEFHNRVDFFVHTTAEPSKTPSTIIDITTTPFTLVRPGQTTLPAEFFQED